jgi:hypothetical protein
MERDQEEARRKRTQRWLFALLILCLELVVILPPPTRVVEASPWERSKRDSGVWSIDEAGNIIIDGTISTTGTTHMNFDENGSATLYIYEVTEPLP